MIIRHLKSLFMPQLKKADTVSAKVLSNTLNIAAVDTAKVRSVKGNIKRSAIVLARRNMVASENKQKDAMSKKIRIYKNENDKRKKQLFRAEGGFRFWVNEGPVLADLRELHVALGKMTVKQWMHHVGKGKNDFVPWVSHVLSDTSCAEDIRVSKNAADAKRAVEKALKKYE